MSRFQRRISPRLTPSVGRTPLSERLLHRASVGYSHMAAFAFVLVLAAGSACVPATAPDNEEQGPVAQATLARQTADADVRRILSGNPSETPTPGPTAAPRPTCQDGIWWYEAQNHIGQMKTIQGAVVRTRKVVGSSSAILEIGQLRPDPTHLTVIVPSGTEDGYMGKSLCVTGVIRLLDGGATVEATNQSAIRILN